MNFDIKLKEIYMKFRKKSPLDVDIDIDLKFLNNFQEPNDLIQRSYFQYLCQIKRNYVIINFIANFVSVLFLFYKIYLNKRKDLRKKDRVKGFCVMSAFYLDLKYIPNELKSTYETIKYYGGEYNKLSKTDVNYIKKIIKRYWRSPFFVYKSLLRIEKYSDIIDKYNPEAIIASCEYSFTSSVLTDYCNQRNVKHINIMHGEKILDITDSFCYFDEYYVWGKEYVDLLTELRMPKKQFKISIPKVMIFDLRLPIINEYTYYLGNETKIELMNIKNILDKLNGKISIRPHPKYTDLNLVKYIFLNYEIQDANLISIEKSVTVTKYVISLYSTVLNQALYNGKEILIDDTSNRNRYEQLKN